MCKIRMYKKKRNWYNTIEIKISTSFQVKPITFVRDDVNNVNGM